MIRTTHENVTSSPFSTQSRYFGASSSNGYLTVIFVPPEKSGNVLLSLVAVAMSWTLSEAYSSWPGCLGARSCMMKARKTPGTSTVVPGGMSVGRYIGSEAIGLSQ